MHFLHLPVGLQWHCCGCCLGVSQQAVDSFRCVHADPGRSHVFARRAASLHPHQILYFLLANILLCSHSHHHSLCNPPYPTRCGPHPALAQVTGKRVLPGIVVAFKCAAAVLVCECHARLLVSCTIAADRHVQCHQVCCCRECPMFVIRCV